MIHHIIKLVVVVAVLVNLFAIQTEIEALTNTVAAYDSDVELAESAVQATQLSNEQLLAGYAPFANIFMHGVIALVLPLLYLLAYTGLGRKETTAVENSPSASV